MSKGGARENAGRPIGSGKYGEATKVMRIPASRVQDIKQLIQSEKIAIPLYLTKVPAGFPSPADDYIESYLDLNEFLIRHPSATFMLKAVGDSMINAGIHSGDILIVDRSIEPSHNKIVVAALNGELTVKRLYKKEGMVKLMPENDGFAPIDITSFDETVIWGVVTSVIKRL